MTLLGIYNFSAMLIKILLLHPIIMYLTNIYQILAMMGFFPLFPLRLYYWNHLSRKYKTERYIFSWIDLLITKQLRQGGINYSEGFFQLSWEHFLSRTFLFRRFSFLSFKARILVRRFYFKKIFFREVFLSKRFSVEIFFFKHIFFQEHFLW